MTKAAANSALRKSKAQAVFEYVLLSVCLCVIALRATYSEGPAPQTAAQPVNLSDIVYSLALSLALLAAFLVWFVWSFWKRTSSYRRTGIEIGLCLLLVAAIISGLAASNKRAAISAVVTFLVPILMAILLVQILDSDSKVKLVLMVIAALGIASAYECAYQFFVTNRMMIAQYEQSPESLLEPLGMEPGSFSQWQFEHRLYSKDIKGFFTTGNSAGSFAILAAFAALSLVVGSCRNHKLGSVTSVWLLKMLALLIIIVGLALTHSKGAIAAGIAATIGFVVYCSLRDWLKAHRTAVVVLCLLAVAIMAVGAVWYWITHGGLPGGNSMLVRWQYWQASVEMYAEHPLRGVGPGNFRFSYPPYKPASAIETVSDPHNFLLAVLAQYGPIGLAGLLAVIFIPLWRTLFCGPSGDSPPQWYGQGKSTKAEGMVLIGVSLSILFLRPIVFPAAAYENFAIMLYAVFALYIAPGVTFGVGCWLLWPRCSNNGHTAQFVIAALFCAVFGLLVHNLIDFAIFEPGVYTAFWAVMACMIALDLQRRRRPQFVFNPAALTKVTAFTGAAVLLWAYFAHAFVPVVKATAGMQLAIRDPQYADALLEQAANDDQLDPTAWNLKGRLHLHQYEESPVKEPALLEKAEQSFLAAIKRNNADFKNFELLAEAYTLLAEQSGQPKKTDLLNKAFDSASGAIRRYPGCARLRIQVAKIAEQLGKKETALAEYKQAVEIEDSYRAQFRIMYPGRELFSRLGEEKYDFAKEKIKSLSQKAAR